MNIISLINELIKISAMDRRTLPYRWIDCGTDPFNTLQIIQIEGLFHRYLWYYLRILDRISHFNTCKTLIQKLSFEQKLLNTSPFSPPTSQNQPYISPVMFLHFPCGLATWEVLLLLFTLTKRDSIIFKCFLYYNKFKNTHLP